MKFIMQLAVKLENSIKLCNYHLQLSKLQKPKKKR